MADCSNCGFELVTCSRCGASYCCVCACQMSGCIPSVQGGTHNICPSCWDAHLDYLNTNNPSS